MIQYVVLPIFALLLTWEYMTSILFQENYFLNRPKWLAFYGFLGSLLFFTTVVLILWKYFLREIRPEEWNRLLKVLLLASIPWCLMRYLWFPFITSFGSWCMSKKIATSCKVVEWMNLLTFFLGFFFIFSMFLFSVRKKAANNLISKESKSVVIPKCPK